MSRDVTYELPAPKSFLALPDEVLAIVIACLNDHSQELLHSYWSPDSPAVTARPDHVALSRVCRRLAALVRDALWQRLDLDLSCLGNNSEPWMTSTSRRKRHTLNLLLRTFHDYPNAPSRIKTVTFLAGDDKRSADDLLRPKLMSLLSQSSVSSLKLLDCQVRDLQVWSNFVISRPKRFQCLESLSIVYHYPHDYAAADLLTLLSWPSLKKLSLDLELSWIDVGMSSDERIPPSPTHAHSLLEELHFGNSRISHDLLVTLLTRCSGLQCLSLPHNGLPIRFCDDEDDNDGDHGRHYETYSFDQAHPFSPRQIWDLLIPFASTLRVLKVGYGTSSEHLGHEEHDGTELSLVDFVQLTELQISCRLIDPRRWRRAERSSLPLWSIFPDSLEKLRIDFDVEEGLFWSRAELKDVPTESDYVAMLHREGPGNPTKTAGSLAWIQVREMKGHLRRLSRFTVQDSWEPYYSDMKYAVPQHVIDLVEWYPQLFHEPEVHVSIEMSVPVMFQRVGLTVEHISQSYGTSWEEAQVPVDSESVTVSDELSGMQFNTGQQDGMEWEDRTDWGDQSDREDPQDWVHSTKQAVLKGWYGDDWLKSL